MKTLKAFIVIVTMLACMVSGAEARDRFGTSPTAGLKLKIPFPEAQTRPTAPTLELHVKSTPVVSSSVSEGSAAATRHSLMQMRLGREAYGSVTVGGRRLFPSRIDNRANLSTGQKVAIGVVVVGAVVALALIAANNQKDEPSFCFFDSECAK